jgi:hypothetical protein
LITSVTGIHTAHGANHHIAAREYRENPHIDVAASSAPVASAAATARSPSLNQNRNVCRNPAPSTANGTHWSQATEIVRLGHVESDPDAHTDANLRMLAETDELIAVWDGQPARDYGGTADVVGTARDLRHTDDGHLASRRRTQLSVNPLV